MGSQVWFQKVARPMKGLASWDIMFDYQPQMTETTMSLLEKISIVKKSNVYFDGKCISHTVFMGDGTRKTIGVMFPSTLTFNTAAPEKMEIVGGVCKVRLQGEGEGKTYSTGESFSIPANSSFDIDTVEFLDYVCHFD